jgi:hypothetical protein
MRIHCLFILFGISLNVSNYCFANTEKDDQFQNLNKKTAQGFVIPYVLRYDPELWTCKSKNGGHEIHAIGRPIDLIICVNGDEKNMEHKEMEQGFIENLNSAFSDDSLYADYRIELSSEMKINGINFFHQVAIINLAPNSMHFKSTGANGWKKTCVSEKGAQEQIDFYTYSGDTGRILFYFRTGRLLTHEDQAAIDELFRGFSFDGSACKGPAALRGLKTMFEVLTNQ